MAEEKLNGHDAPLAPQGNGSAEAGESSAPVNLSGFMMTGRDLLSRKVSRQQRRDDEIRQDLVHQRLFFYSIETFSREKSGPIAEFSWLTADEDLNELERRSGRFLMAIPPDVLPDPVCAAAAGISPSEAQRTGLRENEFAEKILSVLPKGAFCRIGWNNVGFTDERIRALLFRTFHEPYLSGRDGFERTRFDLQTFTRTVFTLRPGIIKEPQGKGMLSLTEVAEANGIETTFKPRMMLELIRLFKEKLPKMLSFYMSLRTKAAMSEYLKRQSLKWIQIVTAATRGEKLSAIPAMPLEPILGKGPDSGRWLMLSLAGEPSEYILNPALLNKEAESQEEEILDTGDSGNDDGASTSGDSEVKGAETQIPKSYGLENYGLFLLSPNRCPAVAPIATLSEERAKELGISAKKAQANYQAYRKDWGTSISAIKLILKKALAERNRMMKDRFLNLPPEERLYEGFVPDSDRELEKELHLVEESSPLEVRDFRFGDDRLNGMLFTYIGRNLPETMTDEELAEWKRLCDKKIEKQLPEFRKRCGEALQRFGGDEKAMAILKEFALEK